MNTFMNAYIYIQSMLLCEFVHRHHIMYVRADKGVCYLCAILG